MTSNHLSSKQAELAIHTLFGEELSYEQAVTRCRQPEFFPARKLRQSEDPPHVPLSRFSDPEARKVFIHQFAVHEIQAAEAIAWALLVFSDHQKFVYEMAATLVEELRHFDLYCQRLEELRQPFGSIGVSWFLWSCLTNVSTPEQFTAGLSLTFEQANLDFAGYFATRFLEIGDTKTASILQTIYEDEIRHVARGVDLLGPGLSVSDHENLLKPPLTIDRAKGTIFDAKARLQAGLTSDYVDSLRFTSKGFKKKRRIWQFNAEDDWPDKAPDSAIQAAKEFAPLLGFLARPEEVILSRPPPFQFLSQWQQILQAPMPEFRERFNEDSWEIKKWRSTPVKSKTWIYEKLPNHMTCYGCVINRSEELDKCFTKYGPNLLLKSIWGASGQGQRKLFDGKISENEQGWIKNILLRDDQILVETLHQRIADFSIQCCIDRGKLVVQNISQTMVDSQGRYCGCYLSKFHLAKDVVRQISPKEISQSLRESANLIYQLLNAEKYEGPFGLDAYLYRDDEGVKLRSMVELNQRFTMGHIAAKFVKLVKSNQRASWRLLHKRELSMAIPEFERVISSHYPLDKQGNQLISGVVPTSFHTPSSTFLSYLVLGEDANHCFDEITHKSVSAGL